MARNPPEYFAKRLADTMKGAGTYDRALIRNMVLRSEIDMVQIKQEFLRKYGKTLESFIQVFKTFLLNFMFRYLFQCVALTFFRVTVLVITRKVY